MTTHFCCHMLCFWYRFHFNVHIWRQNAIWWILGQLTHTLEILKQYSSIQTRELTWFIYKIMKEKQNGIQQKITTNELWSLSVGQAHAECGRVKLVCGHQSLPLSTHFEKYFHHLWFREFFHLVLM